MSNKIEKIVKLMGFSKNTYFNWQKENRPIISLVKKYFSEEEIEEFLKTGEISKLEKINNSKKNNEAILKQINDLVKGLK